DNALTDNNIIIVNCEMWNGYYGVYSYGVSATPQTWVFNNNLVKDFYYYGLYFYYHNNTLMNENTVESFAGAATVYAFNCYYCDGELEVIKNRVHAQGSGTLYGMRVAYCDAAYGAEGKVYNNMVTLSGSSTAANYGAYWYTNTYTKYYHNSILAASGSTSGRAAYIYNGANSESKNNIFANTSGGYTVYYYGSPLTLSDYNNYYSNGTVLGYWGSGNVADLAALQLASGMETYGVSVNPEFSSPGMLYPGSVGMNNLGTPLTEVPDDIFGTLRSTTTPDMGCVEYSPPQNDAGIISIDQPVSPLGPGSHSITASLKNYGIQNLTSATLSFSVNGGTPVSTVWVGNLLSGGTDGPVTIGSHVFPYGTHQIKVWTSNPNLTTDDNALNDTMVMMVNVCEVMDSTYTIGDTALGADYPSFAAAIDAMLYCGIGATVTFNVWPGTYNELVTVPVIPGASFSNRVVFQSSTGVASDVIVQGTPASAAVGVWTFDGADYIDVQNLTIQVATGATYGRAMVFVNKCDYNYIGGNIIRTTASSTSSNYSGIYSASGSLDEYNVFAYNTIENGYYGIYWYGSSTTSLANGNVFEGNIISNFYYYGIFLYYQNALVVTANELTGLSSAGYNYGLYMYYCDGPQQITKNKITLSGTSYLYGIYHLYNDATQIEPALLANNWIAVPNATATAGRGIYTGYSNYQSFYHNSVSIQTAGTLSYPMYFYASTTTVADIEMVNNIFANFGGGHALYISAATYVPMVTWGDYNNLFSTGVNLGYAGVNYSDLASWQLGTGLDSNSVSTDPYFSSSTLLYPGAPAMDNLGTALMQVGDDIFGMPRSLTTPDMGAVEYTPPQDDAGVVSIDSPGTPIAPGTYPISATIKNFGLVNLLTAYIHYSVNGGPASSVFWVGPISPDSTDGPVTLGNHTFGYGTHQVKVWTSSPNGAIDGNHLNDTAMLTVVVCDIISGTFTIGDTSMGADFPGFQSAINSLTSCGINDTVIFVVSSGTYQEQVTIPQIPGAGPGARVIFRSVTGVNTDVVLTYAPSSSTDYWVLRLDGADYTTFENITVKVGTGASYGRALYLRAGANYNEFLGCDVQTLIATSSSYYALYSDNTLDEYNRFEDCSFSGGYYCFYMYGQGTGEAGTIVRNCSITDWYYYGVYLYYQASPLFTHNYVSNGSNSTTAYAFRNYYTFGPFETSYNTIELTNSGAAYPMYFYYCNNGGTDTGRVYNNLMTHTGTGAGYNNYIYYSSNVHLYNNTYRTSGTGYGLYLPTTANVGIHFVNNLVSTGGYAVYSSSATYLAGLGKMDHNNLYTTGASLAYLGGALSNLSAWQAASTMDSNSVSVDPGFLSPTNPTPSNGTMNNLAVAVSYIVDDIYGTPRGFTPDLGAIEFDPVAYEAELVKISGPVGGCDQTIDSVRILILNRGALVIDDSLTASYVLEGSPVVVTEAVPLVINPNDTVEFTFSVPMNLMTTVDTIYKLRAWI
ncbi:MAG: right-handed parallel beta-helix repeat-containing protein, partial [Bacteroidales bacterium]|nr:right-handed parallel beta-helix repeat-containing protein [Bacteroidales bacterium]